MKNAVLVFVVSLLLSCPAFACIEITPVDGEKFAAIDHPFLITFRDEGLTVEITVSYEPKPGKYGSLSTLHGDLKVQSSVGKKTLDWVLSKTEQDMKGNFSIPSGKAFVKNFSVKKADLDRAMLSGGFELLGESVKYEYVLGDIFRTETKSS